ncbi:MAG: sulfatase-like hydrolase/transferase [Tepidisphaeraceae bacterium]
MDSSNCRFRWNLVALAWLICVAAVPRNASAAAPQTALPSKPNLVLILMDDMGYGDIGPFGSKLNRTPALDRMASEGMRLTSFLTCPVCTPSRAQFMTGCYAKRVSMPGVIFPSCPTGLNPTEQTLPKLLKQQGYATLAIGKWHLGDQKEFLPTQYGFGHYFGLPYSNDMGGGEEWPKDGVFHGKKPPLPLVRDLEVVEVVPPAAQDRLTERYTEEAVKFIRENKDRPFFLYLPHTAVHVPLHPVEKFKSKSGNGTYGDWVEEADWSVGRVLDVLRELKLEGKTLVIFTSDNGPWLTQGKNGGTAGPLHGGKGSTWEGGVREPTIAWWPGKIAPGTSNDAMVANLDVLPTFVKLAGGRAPTDRKIDGVDIWPVLSGQAKESSRQAHYYFNGNRLEAVRSGPWKLAIRPQNEGKQGEKPITAALVKQHKPRLYNLVDDIGENKDVAAEHPEVVEQLQKLVAEMDADLGSNALGPGVRKPGRVENPVPLLPPGIKYVPEAPATQPSGPVDLGKMKIGEVLGKDHAPQVANRPVSISVDVESQNPNGVIVAHGGLATGYALYLRDGKLLFTVKVNRVPVTITASQTPSGRFSAEARLATDCSMTLFINGQKVAEGKANSLLLVQPAENFCVGFDDKQPVGDYGNPVRFSGKIENLKVSTEEKP